jgi:hypothetical protein
LLIFADGIFDPGFQRAVIDLCAYGTWIGRRFGGNCGTANDNARDATLQQ